MEQVELDGCRFALKSPFDFGFLEPFGRVFFVFGQNDSGNISFGVESGGRRHFIKVAGPQTPNAGVAPREAIGNLWLAMGAYEALAHPDLIRLVSHGEVPGGYAAMFRWAEGACLHDHWNFDARTQDDRGRGEAGDKAQAVESDAARAQAAPGRADAGAEAGGTHPKYDHPASPYARFAALPLPRRLAALDTVFDFHAHVAECGWVAVDFYDGSILYDFDTHTTRICDIDFYARAPFTNTMGRMWGSARFMAPEEHTLGAVIDERTMVYTMGAAAFALLGGRQSRERAAWPAGEALYAVAKRAVEDERAKRWPSLAAFIAAWNEAKAGAGV